MCADWQIHFVSKVPDDKSLTTEITSRTDSARNPGPADDDDDDDYRVQIDCTNTLIINKLQRTPMYWVLCCLCARVDGGKVNIVTQDRAPPIV